MKRFLSRDSHARQGSRQPAHISFAFTLKREAGLLRASRFPPVRALSVVVSAIYRAYALVVCSMDMPVRTMIGDRLTVFHGIGLVVHADVIIGSDVVLRHGVTLGERSSGGGVPRIGDRVEIGAGAMILGPVVIGDRARIGANSVVLSDVPMGAVVVGNPGRIIGTKA